MRTICTYCGKRASPVTWDDPFPKALWTGLSKDRPLKVPSCKTCNHHSNESILKHFFVALDSRFYADTLNHLKNPRGKGDFRTFMSVWAEVGGKMYMYLDEKLTAKFVKMFKGIRRHLLNKKWFFVPAVDFNLFKIDKHNDLQEVRPLPLNVGGPNPAVPLSPEFCEMLNEPMRHKFRDFRFEWFADDDDGMVMGLKYEREEFAHLGNRLYLVCFIPNTPKLAAQMTGLDSSTAVTELLPTARPMRPKSGRQWQLGFLDK